MEKTRNKAFMALIVSLILIICGSLLAQVFNTSMYSVKVKRIYFDTDRGTLSGLLYLPKDVSASNPAPTLVTTHGYLNSAEMQDANAIEMSRRGYVVLALDQYDHGHSRANSNNTGAFFSFWPYSVYDAVSYMYKQNYVQKDNNGNGIIGVTGHSMGGFSSSMAVYMDEQNQAKAGHRMISAILTEGSDYRWSSFLGLDTATASANAGGRFYGKVAAQFDEFFFLDDAKEKATVVHKDYVNTKQGKIFLDQKNAKSLKSETWYKASDGGMRIVYQPYQTHPWNHFSKTTTADLLSFYDVAFAGHQANIKSIKPTNQIWQFKEASEFIALCGFIVMIMALASLLIDKVSFFNKVKTGAIVVTQPESTVKGKIAATSLFIATMLIPGIIFPTMYDSDYAAESMRWLSYFADVVIICGVVGIIISALSKEINEVRTYLNGAIVLTISGILLRIMTTDNFVNTNFFGNIKIFSAVVPASILKWALACAFITVIVMTVVYLYGKKDNGYSLANYGIQAKGNAIARAFVLALTLTVVAYIVLFVVDAIFKTDFRIWTFAFKTFEATHVSSSLIYILFFFIYYFVAAAASVSNTTSEKLQGFGGYVLAALTNMGGILIWIILQYGSLFATGTAYYPTQALSGILLFALIPTLAIASCYSKYLYKKTGNIWTAGFLNAMLMTIMTIANTTVYWQLG